MKSSFGPSKLVTQVIKAFERECSKINYASKIKFHEDKELIKENAISINTWLNIKEKVNQ
jgi:hypothetical protein